MYWRCSRSRDQRGRAQLFVADAYAYGQGVDTDLVQAYMWYEVAIRYWGDLAVHARDGAPYNKGG